MTDREPPYSVNRGHVERDGYLLTHVEWHPSNMHGIDIGQPETGVRRKVSGGDYGDFELIQHGWRDFDAAGDVILRGLAKGWDVYRIAKLMDWLENRRRPIARFL